MRAVSLKVVCLVGLLACAVAQGAAQEKGPTASTTDPRVGLKPGLRDAGIAAKNMELVATLGKPEGFFDPKSPAGDVVPPERPQDAGAANGAPSTGATPSTPPMPQSLRPRVCSTDMNSKLP